MSGIQIMKRLVAISLTFLLLLSFTNFALAQAKTVFKCKFEDLAFYITIDEADLTARLGTSIGIGNFGQAYFDSLHKVWVVIQYVNMGVGKYEYRTLGQLRRYGQKYLLGLPRN